MAHSQGEYVWQAQLCAPVCSWYPLLRQRCVVHSAWTHRERSVCSLLWPGSCCCGLWLLILFHRHTWIYCLLYYSLNCKNHFSCRFLCNTFPPLEKHKCLPRVFMSYSVVWLTQTWLDLENDSCFRAALRLWTSPLLEALDNANVANVIMVLWLTVCGVTVPCVWLVSLFVIENVCFLRM